MARTLSAQFGELVGTSMVSKPAASSTRAWATASGGVMPRRIATRGNEVGQPIYRTSPGNQSEIAGTYVTSNSARHMAT